jgi:hypothetical protein
MLVMSASGKGFGETYRKGLPTGAESSGDGVRRPGRKSLGQGIIPTARELDAQAVGSGRPPAAAYAASHAAFELK